MMPARNDCPSGWTEEYHGYLMTSHYTHKNQKEFICVDRDPAFIPGTQANTNGALMYFNLSDAHVEEICRVVHMFQVESLLALFAPSERKNGPHCISTAGALGKKNVNLRK